MLAWYQQARGGEVAESTLALAESGYVNLPLPPQTTQKNVRQWLKFFAATNAPAYHPQFPITAQSVLEDWPGSESYFVAEFYIF